MNAPAALPAPPAPPPATRIDGWQPDRRATFLAALSEGHTVEAACRHVALSPASAYALRRRDPHFAHGWRAAALLAREALADILTSRAIDGQVDTYTRADGQQVTRHRYDNRLAQAMLARLDRLAEMPVVPGTAEPLDAPTARAIAADFDGFLELVEQAADDDAIDAFVADQVAHTSQLPQLRAPEDEDEEEYEIADEDDPNLASVWFDDDHREWRTEFPPPRGFRGQEYGEYGDFEYCRTLTIAEIAAAQRDDRTRVAAARIEGARRRDLWLGLLPPDEAGEDADAARP